MFKPEDKTQIIYLVYKRIWRRILQCLTRRRKMQERT